MARIALEFLTGKRGIALEATVFSHPLLPQTISSKRGKLPSKNYAGTFSWTSALKAFSLLCLKASIPDSIPIILGSKGSLASSLDYSISKQPIWMMEMFGVDSNGRALIRRLLDIRNSGRKRAGPVEIELKRDKLKIDIILDGAVVTSFKKLLELIASLEDSSVKTKRRVSLSNKIETTVEFKTNGKAPSNNLVEELDLSAPFNDKNFLKYFKNHYISHVRKVLVDTNIFSNTVTKKEIQKLINDNSFSSIAGVNARRLESLLDFENKNFRLGLINNQENVVNQINDGPTIRVALSPASIGPLVLFAYLKEVVKLDIDINFKHMNSIVMTNGILTGEGCKKFDICSLSSGSYASLLSRQDRELFKPYMVSPRVPYGVIQARNGNSENAYDGDYCFISDHPSTSKFYFEKLARGGKVKESRISVSHMEQDEIMELFVSGECDVKTILWFPYDLLNAFFNRSVFIEKDGYTGKINEIMLASERFLLNSKRAGALQRLLRHTWLNLIESKSSCLEAVDKLFSLPDYLNTLGRCSGFRSFDSSKIENRIKELSSLNEDSV